MRKNKGKHWLALLLVLCMVCTVMAMPVQAQEDAGLGGQETAGETSEMLMPKESEETAAPAEDGTDPAALGEADGAETPQSSAPENTAEPETAQEQKETTASEKTTQAPASDKTAPEDTAEPGAETLPAETTKEEPEQPSESTESAASEKQEETTETEAAGTVTTSSAVETPSETTGPDVSEMPDTIAPPSDLETPQETTLPADTEVLEEPETTEAAPAQTPAETAPTEPETTAAVETTAHQETSAPETSLPEETGESLEEMRGDVSALVYQEGGLGMDSSAVFALEGDAEARAGDLERAKALLLEALSNWSTEEVDISACGLTVEELRIAYSGVINENPKLFYVDGTYTYWSSNGKVTLVVAGYSSAYTQKDVDKYTAALNKAYAEAVPSGMTDPRMIALACNDYLAQHMEYDKSLEKYNAYNALVEGTAVCQGYSLAYGAMLQKAGIPFGYVNSVAMNHMWNLVQLDGAWYHVDVTWADPLEDRTGFVNHRYFLNSDAKISKEANGGHYNWTSPQECTSTIYDNAYWQQKGVSAIFGIGGKEYYLEYPADSSSATIRLICRSGSSEQEILSFEARWYTMDGMKWYPSVYATLSYYDGNFYVNDADSIYRINPASPSLQKVYTYPGTDGRIYGSLVCDGNIQISIIATPGGTPRKETIPLPTGQVLSVSILASSSEAVYGYTAGPVLTAEPVLADGETRIPEYQWYKVSSDGTQTAIDGAVGESYTVETGLNAGTYTYRVHASLDDMGCSGDIKITVKPLEITPTAEITGTYIYTGSEQIPTVTVKQGQNILPSSDYVVTCSDNINAGTAKAVITPAKGSNYTWNPLEVLFTIQKAVYKGETKVVQTVRYGATGEVDLSQVLAGALQFGEILTADPDGILSGAPVLSGTTLTCTLKDDAANTDKTAEITIPVTESSNYQAYSVTVYIVVGEKLPQVDFGFAESTLNKTYGDMDFTAAAAGAQGDSKVSYSSSDPEVAVVDGTGKIRILKAGTTTITAHAAATEDYLEASASCVLYVAPKALGWDVSALGAADRADSADGKKKTDAAATLYGELKVSGILETDQSQAVFQCPAELLAGAYENTAAGSQKVVLAWREAGKEAVLTGEKAENYVLPSSLPAINGKINEVLSIPLNPSGQTQFRLDVEAGISRVPEALKAIEALCTPEKIETWMRTEIQKLSGQATESGIAIYDVTLMIQTGSQGWIKADRNNFPAEGLTVTLPYPEGTGKDSHDFVALHLFTEDMNGFKAGETESPQVTKTEKGIEFTVRGLSPISVGWKEAVKPEEKPENKPEEKPENKPETGTPPSYQTPNSSPSAAGSAATGDNSQVLLYAGLLAASAAGILLLNRRRKDEELKRQEKGDQ